MRFFYGTPGYKVTPGVVNNSFFLRHSFTPDCDLNGIDNFSDILRDSFKSDLIPFLKQKAQMKILRKIKGNIVKLGAITHRTQLK